LASDRELLAEMRKGLRMEIRQSKLMDSQAFTHSLEDAYRQMWHRWCDEKQ
jgi:predicted O-linked N-acetylglucosamine transferase (SPINDLY family)